MAYHTKQIAMKLGKFKRLLWVGDLKTLFRSCCEPVCHIQFDNLATADLRSACAFCIARVAGRATLRKRVCRGAIIRMMSAHIACI